MDKTHDSNLKSWIEVDEKSDFPIQNIPFGVYSPKDGGDLHVATAIGNYVLDLAYLDEAGYFQNTEVEGTEIFHEPTLNAFMSLGRKAWKDTRNVISHLLSKDTEKLRDNKELRELALVPMEDTGFYLKAGVGYADAKISESLTTNSNYPDTEIYSAHVSLGYEMELEEGFLRAEAGYSTWEDTTVKSSSGRNQVEVELEGAHARISVGTSF